MITHYNTNSTNRKEKGSHLNFDARLNIERWHQEGLSNREIARRLNRAPQTINNELKRGLVRQQTKKGKFEHVYRADYGQTAYEIKRKKSVKPTILTPDRKEIILHYMNLKYSPEFMVKRGYVDVSFSTIYYWIHHGHLGISPKAMLYPRRKKKSHKKDSTFRLKGKSIEERPESINQRAEFGHYEIDTVIFTKEKNMCLLTLTERKYRHQIIRLIPDKSAESVNRALEAILDHYEIKSITADNGTEFFKLHEVFEYEHIYYAHPYCSHERGTNENHNRLIRRFLPKGTTETTPEEVAKIENWINNYPKKCLDYKTPFEMMKAG